MTAGLSFFAPGNQNSEAPRRSTRSSVSMRRPARAGCKDAPTPPPPIHTRRCALAQPPRRSWPPRRWDQLLVRHGSRAAAHGRLVSNLGCTSGRTTFREQPARHPARWRWLAADVATFASIYMELRPARLRGGFLRVCHLHFDLDGRSAGSTSCLRRRKGGDGRVMRAHFSIPNPNSRFSFHRGLAVRVIPHFCVQITE